MKNQRYQTSSQREHDVVRTLKKVADQVRSMQDKEELEILVPCDQENVENDVLLEQHEDANLQERAEYDDEMELLEGDLLRMEQDRDDYFLDVQEAELSLLEKAFYNVDNTPIHPWVDGVKE